MCVCVCVCVRVQSGSKDRKSSKRNKSTFVWYDFLTAAFLNVHFFLYMTPCDLPLDDYTL